MQVLAGPGTNTNVGLNVDDGCGWLSGLPLHESRGR
jgi:hypothetical protein